MIWQALPCQQARKTECLYLVLYIGIYVADFESWNTITIVQKCGGNITLTWCFHTHCTKKFIEQNYGQKCAICCHLPVIRLPFISHIYILTTFWVVFYRILRAIHINFYPLRRLQFFTTIELKFTPVRSVKCTSSRALNLLLVLWPRF